MNFEQKSDYINELVYDLNAEYLISCLINEELKQDDIWVFFDGDFKRKWSKDIDFAGIENLDNNNNVLALHLNRAGIYDSLPEFLFHSFSKETNASGKEMAKESMRLKAEEKKVRLFFNPIENELFFQKVSLALKENEIYNSLFVDLLNGLIPGFWKIDDKIPSEYILKLVKILPFAHRFIGEYKLTAQSLEYIIGEKVTIKFNNDTTEDIKPEDKMNKIVLGNNYLGHNTIIGENVSGLIGKLIFMIGPLQTTDIRDYFKDGPVGRLLKCFFGYFIPVECDVEIKLIVQEEQNKCILGSDKEQLSANSYLGYNIVL